MNDRPDSMIPACPAPAEVTPPKIPLSPKACDTHAHVFGPASQFPYAADRSYTPPDAPLAKYLAMLATLGVEEALVAANSDRLVWGADCPHPRMEAEMPDAGHLLDLFHDWTPNEENRRRILIDNPARLYDFPQ